ncbi:polysaccharide deacetylase family protein [Flavobacterium sp.]|uniref:polysaccharide deacetylase family protein n=1 Tax=Flavobacterium sp. TaxID=239 RepID=UPI0025BF8D09|nr:polysaccharide deacetylase family protein [Flavobacterium sp.]
MKHKIVNITFITILSTLALLSLFVAINWWYFAIAGLLWFGIAFTGSAWIESNYHVKAYCSGENKIDRKIALTFDDGPSIFTIPVLDILREHNAEATFFCIGKNIDEHPDIFKHTISEGHLVGNHSYWHGRDFDFKKTDAVLEELQKTDAAILKYSGKKANFFRPPYGVTNPKIRRALEASKHKVIGWNIRSMDGVSKDEKAILKRIVSQLKPGAIVLLHDTSAVTVSVLEQLLLTLRDKKFEVVSLEELLQLKAYEED